MTSPARSEPVDIPSPKNVTIVVVSLFPRMAWYNDVYMPTMASYQLGFMYFSDCRKNLFDGGTPKLLRDHVQAALAAFEPQGADDLSEAFYTWLLEEGHWVHYHKQPLKRWNDKKRPDPHLEEEIGRFPVDSTTFVLLGSEVQRWAKRTGLADRVPPENYIELHLPTADGKNARYWSPDNARMKVAVPRLVAKLRPRVKEKPPEGSGKVETPTPPSVQ